MKKRANEAKRLKQKNEEFAAFNYDRSLGFDGRYGGPTPTTHRDHKRRKTDPRAKRYWENRSVCAA